MVSKCWFADAFCTTIARASAYIQTYEISTERWLRCKLWKSSEPFQSCETVPIWKIRQAMNLTVDIGRLLSSDRTQYLPRTVLTERNKSVL
jgi:hypothetical protein